MSVLPAVHYVCLKEGPDQKSSPVTAFWAKAWSPKRNEEGKWTKEDDNFGQKLCLTSYPGIPGEGDKRVPSVAQRKGHMAR